MFSPDDSSCAGWDPIPATNDISTSELPKPIHKCQKSHVCAQDAGHVSAGTFAKFSARTVDTNRRHRKCDEAKPHCNNCVSTNRTCEGYQMKLMFNTDGHRLKDVFAVLKRKLKPKNGSDSDSALGYSAAAMNRSISSSEQSQLLETDLPVMMRLSLLKKELVEDVFEEVSSQQMDPQNTTMEATTPSKTAKFNTALFENLDSFLRVPPELAFQPEGVAKSPLTQLFDDLLTDTANGDTNSLPDDAAVVPPEFMPLMGPKTVFDGGRIDGTVTSAGTAMSYQEENRMLRHFFQKLLPLLDAHPRSPWPDLALRYCDFDVARSCFISLACIHIYESREGGNEYYKQGIAHIHSTMSHLIQSISSSTSSLTADSSSALPSSKSTKLTSFSALDVDGPTAVNIRSFVIIVLVNVHILFAVLEKGKSSLARYLLKVFASLCHALDFYESLKDHESKLSLVSVLSWYDTVSAIVSPDCRLPFCSPDWYGTMNDDFSTLHMMGCPGEIFTAMLEVCFLRHEIHEGYMRDDARFRAEFERVKQQLFAYRDYIKYSPDQDYVLQLKGAQCWALAVWVSLLRLYRTEERQRAISAAVNEFINIYASMPSTSPTITQMVWPVYAIGCECVTPTEREALHRYMVRLYETAQMGTLFSLRWIVEQVWERGVTQEEVLLDWLEEKVDYLPL